MTNYIQNGFTFDETGALVVSGGTGGGDGGTDGDTADTGEHFKLVWFGDGTVKAIPFSAEPPATPTDLATDVHLTSVKLTWTAATRADHYRVYRDDVYLSDATGTSYRDTSIAISETYTYTLRAVDQYGEWSDLSSGADAFIDPSLNSPPTIAVTQWGPYLRVNASDVDAQILALTLDVDAGTLSVTDDPSVWRLTV